MPCLTDNMQWREDLPLFVTGQLAALRLGPGAGNLAGAKLGAERVSWSIQKLLAQIDELNKEDGDIQMFNYATTSGNRFYSLIDYNPIEYNLL